MARRGPDGRWLYLIDHPFDLLYQLGFRVTVNCDNRLMSNTSMTQEMFSSKTITPGKTKTSDLVWWWRQTVHDLGLGTWFQPSVSVQRQGRTAEQLGADPVIERFLPKQLSQAEMQDAIDQAIAEIGATSIKDMGKVMGVLKANHAGRMDFGKAGALVKGKLA